MGLGSYSVTDDIETNVQLGTWYLRYVRDSLSGNEVMATAAYNAGPAVPVPGRMPPAGWHHLCRNHSL
jgi:soluble lytic murein transglycosylase-like protein